MIQRSEPVVIPLPVNIYTQWDEIKRFIIEHKHDMVSINKLLHDVFGLPKSTVYALLKTLDLFIGSWKELDHVDVEPVLGQKLSEQDVMDLWQEIESYKKLGREGFIKTLMDKYRLTYWAASKLYYHEGGHSKYDKRKHEEPIGKGFKSDEILDWRAYLEEMEHFRHRINYSEGDVNYDSVYEWHVSTSKVGVIFTSDWHLGSRFTDYKRLKEHIELLMENFHVFLVGDMVDMFLSFKNKAVEFQQIVPPTTQLKLLYSILLELQQKGRLHVILLSSQRVHDSAVSAAAGFDPYQFFDGLNTVYFRNKGTVYVRMPQRTWEVLILHKYGRNSYRNPFSRHVYAIDNVSATADVIVMAHLHRRDYASFYFGGKQRVCINLPGFKYNDPYTQSYFDQHEAPFPVVVFDDDNNTVDVYPSPEVARYVISS